MTFEESFEITQRNISYSKYIHQTQYTLTRARFQYAISHTMDIVHKCAISHTGTAHRTFRWDRARVKIDVKQGTVNGYKVILT